MHAESGKTGIVSGILLPIGLVCLFAFCSLALALLGGRAYKAIQAGVDDGYGSVVASAYLRTKLSQNNHSDAVSLRDEGGVQVLVIAQPAAEGETAYETRIYMVDGALMESYVAAGTPFSPVGDIQIAQISSCTFYLSEDGLFVAEIVSPRGVETRTVFAVTEGGAL